MRDADLNPGAECNLFSLLDHGFRAQGTPEEGFRGYHPYRAADKQGRLGSMDAVLGLVAFLVTLVAVVAAAGHAGYLAMLTSAAKKRPGGQPAADFAKKRYPVAGATLAVTLLAMLLSTGDGGTDVLAILLGGGGGFASLKALQGSQNRFRSGQY